MANIPFTTKRIPWIKTSVFKSDFSLKFLSTEPIGKNVYWTVCSGADQRQYQSFASLAFFRGIHRWTVNSPQKGPVWWKMCPFDDTILAMVYPKRYEETGRFYEKIFLPMTALLFQLFHWIHNSFKHTVYGFWHSHYLIEMVSFTITPYRR